MTAVEPDAAEHDFDDPRALIGAFLILSLPEPEAPAEAPANVRRTPPPLGAAKSAFMSTLNYLDLGMDVERQFYPDMDEFGPNLIYPDFDEAEKFVLANRDAPAEAIPTHLALKKLPGGTMTPTPLHSLLWGVFRTTLLAVTDYLAATAPKPAAEPAQASGREQAFRIADDPLSPSGFSARP